MTLRITGKHMDVGDALRGRIQDRVEESVSKYFGGGYSGHVVLTKQGSRFSAGCTLFLDSGISLQTEGKGQDAYAAFDEAAEHLDKRLRRNKRKVKDHSGPSARYEGAAYDLPALAEPEPYEMSVEEATASVGEVVVENARNLARMSPAEAVMTLDASTESFIAFLNAANGHLNVVFHRPDGNIGWLDPSNGLDKAA